MNIILLIDKKNPAGPPLVFIAPDDLTGPVVEDCLKKKHLKKYHVVHVDGDQPTVVGDWTGIAAILKDDE